MMTSTELKQAHVLVEKIRETERLLATYRAAGDVVVGLPPEERAYVSPDRLLSRVTLNAHEIGNVIVKVLEERIETMKRRLHEMGVELAPDEDDQPDHEDVSPSGIRILSQAPAQERVVSIAVEPAPVRRRGDGRRGRG